MRGVLFVHESLLYYFLNVYDKKEEEFMKADIKELLENYMEQDSKEQNLAYDDEMRAEADLCAECCACCRVCWISA